LTSKEWEAFIDLVIQQIDGKTVFDAATISGRMPSGVKAEEVTSLVRVIMDANIPCFVDSAGDTLGPLLAAKPTAVKINNSEASNYFGQSVNTLHEAGIACRQVVSQGIELCIITMGIHGAVGATKSEAYHVEIDGKGLWPVGSGDSFLAAAAVKWAQRRSLLDGMIAGTAAGTANAHRQIAGLLDMERFERVLKDARYTKL
jgi:fructose-1-phosphate kinase PfkB-like protein